MSRKFLYRRLGAAVIFLALAAIAVPESVGQGMPQLKRPNDLPEDKPPEPKKKKVKGPRAVGIVQFGGVGKATLLPVAVLVDGRFYDASAYKADPVPMALESGTVYEAEEAGESQGLFTVIGALHSKNPGSVSPWVGTGSFLAQGAEAPKRTRKAEDVPVGLDTSGDEPPRLTRGNGANGGTARDSSQSGAGSKGSSSGSGTPDKASAPGAPTSEKASGSSAGGSASGENGAKTTSTSAPADKSADPSAKEPGTQAQKTGEEKPGEQGASSPSSSNQNPVSTTSQSQSAPSQGTENYYRPTLRRGKPTQAAPDQQEAVAKIENTTPPAAAADSTATTDAVRFVPAISDAGGPDPQSYKFFWKEGEEEERRKQILELAANEVRAYVTAREKGTIPARPVAKASSSNAANRKSTGKSWQPVFEDIQFRAFDVWKNNQPVMVLTAQAHVSPPPKVMTAPEAYSITLVTRTDIYGNLRKLYSGVTDKFHLDVTPRLELIDVVDADGDGRGELLFRETTDAGKGYLIYRATGDKLWKMFDSLGE